MYIHEERIHPNTDSRKYFTELRNYCNKFKPFVSYYSKLIHSYNRSANNILQNEIDHYYLKYQDKTWNYHHISIKFHWFSL